MNTDEHQQAQTQRTKRIAKRPWLGALLNLHFFASVFVAVMIAFYALSGFLAMHPHWFGVDDYAVRNHDPERLPSHIELSDLDTDDQALRVYCSALLGNDAVVKRSYREDDVWWVHVEDERHRLSCRVHIPERSVEQVLMHKLRSDAPSEATALRDYIHGQLGGSLDAESFFHDEDMQTLSFTLESVWFEKQINVFLKERLFQVTQKTEPIVGGIINLHKGEHANGFQTFLADLTAILLLFVVFSGLFIGLKMKKRRRMTILACVISCVLLVLFVIAR